MRLGRNRASFRALAGVALLAMTGLVACGSDSKSSSSSATTTPTTAAAAGAAAAGTTSLRAGLNDPNDNNIAILQYLPQSVTVTAGSTVEWRIAGPEPHTITFLPPGQAPPTPDKADPLFVPTPAANGTYDGKSLVNSGLLPQGPRGPQGAVRPLQRAVGPGPGLPQPAQPGQVALGDGGGLRGADGLLVQAGRRDHPGSRHAALQECPPVGETGQHAVPRWGLLPGLLRRLQRRSGEPDERGQHARGH